VSMATKPINAVGIVPTIIKGISCPYSVLKSRCMRAERIFLMSSLKKTKMTIKVPICKITSKSIGMLRSKKCSASLKCPVLDIGSHSAMP